MSVTPRPNSTPRVACRGTGASTDAASTPWPYWATTSTPVLVGRPDPATLALVIGGRPGARSVYLAPPFVAHIDAQFLSRLSTGKQGASASCIPLLF